MFSIPKKISGTLRSEAGATYFLRICSYLSTLRKQGLHQLSALEATLPGQSVALSF